MIDFHRNIVAGKVRRHRLILRAKRLPSGRPHPELLQDRWRQACVSERTVL